MPPAAAIVDINRCVESVARRLLQSAPEIHIVTDLDPGLPEVRGHVDGIEDLLCRLAGALVCPTGPEPGIRLRTDRCDDHRVRVELQAPSNARTPPTLGAHSEGRRLGVDVVGPTHEGDHVSVSVTIPIDPAHKLSPAAEAQGRVTVLLVDDELLLLRTQKRLLMSFGFSVVAARSGEEALELFRINRTVIDWAIIDLGLPDMGTTALFDQLRSEAPQLPIIVMTGYASKALIASFKAQGARAVVIKPVEDLTLIDLLK